MNSFLFNNTVVLNDRLTQGKNSTPFEIPSNNVLVIRDIVIQNRAAGDAPVSATAFSRIMFSRNTDNIDPIFSLTAVGNDTLNIHFETGVPISKTQGGPSLPRVLQVQNAVNSTAPFVEYVITGLLVPSIEK